LSTLTVCKISLADELSPLSMLYAPKSGNGVATSSLGLEITDAQLRSALLNNNGQSHFGLLTQSLDYGLTDTLTASIAEVYAQAFQQNPWDVAQGHIGFRSPRFQLTAWTPLDPHWTIKSAAGLQINPATSSRLNYGALAADAIYQPTTGDDTALAVGPAYTALKDIGSYSQAWHVALETSWGNVHIHLDYARTHLNGFRTTLGPFNASEFTDVQAEVGRKIAANCWGSLGFASERNRYQWLQAPFQMEVSSGRSLQRFTASLKWTWE
jgi:predicted porin